MGFDLTGISSVFDLVGKVVDKIWPDPGQAAQAKLELFKLQQAGELKELEQVFELAKAQIETNQVEAANPNLFVSGWRPAVGWVCVGGLIYTFIAQPLLSWASSIWGFPVPPSLDMGELLTLLLGMLGLGGLRTFEKIQGKASK